MLLILFGCSKSEKTQISGAVAVNAGNLESENLQEVNQADLGKETLFFDQKNNEVIEPLNENKTATESSTLEKKKEVLRLILSSNIDKVKISLLLNEINDVSMIDAWNKLQRCIDCNEYSSLKQDFISATEDSINKDL